MADRPILFSAPMVIAILSGTKKQTRRVVKPQPVIDESGFWSSDGKVHCGSVELWAEHMSTRCPYGQPGDRLWVRETCRADELAGGRDGVRYAADAAFITIENSGRASEQWVELASYGMKKSGRVECRKVPPIHMPRWASRILLEITGIRVERLNDISEADAVAEGITCESVIVDCNCHGGTHQEITAERYFYDGCYDDGFETGIDAYAALWEQINGPGSWAANPFVFVIEFKRITP